jgi:hypothetical protein
MKIGYLVWTYEEDEFPTLRSYPPSWCHRYMQIVYAEIEEDDS